MSKRLAKVAQELNVVIPTIVEFLNSKGLPIENKPTAMVTEDMEKLLEKEFIKISGMTLLGLKGLKILGRIDVPKKQEATEKKVPEKKPKEIAQSQEKPKPTRQEDKVLLSCFEVQNYRSLKCLKLEGLKRVNLITGKNNTGKSSFLEALSIWAVRGRFHRLLEVMSGRSELLDSRKNGNGFYERLSKQDVDKVVREYEPLFFDRKIDYSGNDSIKMIANEKEEIQLRFVRYIIDGLEKKVVGEEAEEFNIGFRLAYFNKHDKTKLLIERHMILSDEVLLRRQKNTNPKWLPENNYQYLGAHHPDWEASQEMLSKITLTDKEDELVKMLKVVERKIERIGFSGEKKDNQIYIRLDGYMKPVLLTSMGYGMSRITSIMLALANSENGFLLVDEFENGLHWTVQEQLWEVVFRLSKQLNVQVFATTHSDDCIRAFSNVVNKSYPDDGVLIRLDNKNGTISPTIYSPEELAIATENLIETRGL